jgi:hypothetical protein
MISLCLVNTYDKLKLHEIHLRSIARAMPICYSYNFHLSLLDFNFWNDEKELVDVIAEYTTIGKGGKYGKMLLEEGKLHLVDKIPSHFGVIIATTSKPDEEKRIGEDELRNIVRGKSACFLIGLGRKGLPKDLIKKSKYHLDITWKGVSLETCSAIGVIASTIYWISR